MRKPQQLSRIQTINNSVPNPPLKAPFIRNLMISRLPRWGEIKIGVRVNLGRVKHLPGVGLYESRLNLSELYEALVMVFKALIG